MSPQTPPPAEFVQIFMEILNVMVGSLAYLPTSSGAPGRASACAGIRAFLHRLIGSIGPDCQVPVKACVDSEGGATETASNWLLLAISSATPQIIENASEATAGDQDLRWRELREHMPLFSQVASRYKVSSIPCTISTGLTCSL